MAGSSYFWYLGIIHNNICFDYILLLYLHIFVYFLVNDTLDDILTESGDEEEQDAIVNQVLDEIGIEISGKVKITIILKPLLKLGPKNNVSKNLLKM